MRLLGCEFSDVDRAATLTWVKNQLMNDEASGYIMTVNVAILMMMRTDKVLADFIKNASLTVVDGQPIVWFSRLLGKPLAERVPGVDLMEDMVAVAAETGKRVYLLGAKETTVHKVADKLIQKYPNLILAGVADGYFSQKEASARADKVRESRADLLIVAMGVPRQENFLRDNWDRFGVKLAIPVGGSFDVIAGETKRAPVWMQKYGMEWFYRICQEPRRLFKRYLVTNTQFIILGLLSLFNERILSRMKLNSVKTH